MVGPDLIGAKVPKKGTELLPKGTLRNCPKVGEGGSVG